MLKCSSSQLKVSCGTLGEDSIIFKSLATGSMHMLKQVHDQYKLDLVYFPSLLFFFVGGHKGGEVNLGRTGSKWGHGALYELSK